VDRARGCQRVAGLEPTGTARLSLFVIATGVGGSLINVLIKSAVNRARPTFPDPVSLAAGRSFPSGHTQSAVVGCGILLIVFSHR
jgi:membrane-associated phospholipid phosphatase